MKINRRYTRLLVLFAALLVTTAISARADDQISSTEKERELLAVLQSDAPAADKAITCKRLAIHGSSKSVPELAKLLPNPQLTSWARIALEAIPGPEADEALLNATKSVKGRTLVGVINSIGVRRNAKAVESLIAILPNEDAAVASAAAVALGHIGTPAAVKSLRASLAIASPKVRSAVAEGCVLSAEKLSADGKTDEAVTIYDEVRAANVPQQRIIEATRGAILARGEEGIPLLLEQFRSTDKKMFQLALMTAREFPGSKVDQALADELANAKPGRAALMIGAMADRPDSVVLPAVLKAAVAGPKPVRLAAIVALRQVGDASCLPALMDVAIEKDTDISQAAIATLAELPGEGVDSNIVAGLKKANGKMYPLLIGLVGQRRIDAIPDLLKALKHSDSEVRQAALTSLGETVKPDGLSVLVSQVVTPKYPEDAAVAQRALKAAGVRMPDREACATELVAAIRQTTSVPTKIVLLQILGDVSGTKALATIGAAAKHSDPRLQDMSSRLLGKWMTADAAPVLLDLSASAPAEKYRVRAMRGYIRIARQFRLSPQERAEMCLKALKASNRSTERKMVLDVLKRYPNREMLKLAVKAMQDPELKEKATEVTLSIAQKLGKKEEEMRELLSSSGLAKVKLEIVKAEYGSGETQKDVTAILREQAGSLPLIVLAASSYNDSFGGDPLPNTTKQLKIQYRINGKNGEATFAENALIILPMPK